MKNASRYFSAIFITLLVVLGCMPAFAEQPNEKALTIVDDNWKLEPEGASISPDGSLLAFAGPQGQRGPAGYGGGLYTKDRRTGEIKPIVGPIGAFNNVAFSADGSHIIFEEITGTGAPYDLYSVETNGSDLVKMIDGDVAGPATYSPDGTKIMVEVNVPAENPYSEEGYLRDFGKNYVTVIPANKAKSIPEKLVEIQPGTPKFWSADGTAIYYTGPSDGVLYKFDLETKKSQITSVKCGNVSEGDVVFHDILGKVPGTDAIFVKNGHKNRTQSLAVLNLDGSSPNPELEKIAESIPLKDAQGYPLQAIQEMGLGQLLFIYSAHKPSLYSGLKHSILISWEKQ